MNCNKEASQKVSQRELGRKLGLARMNLLHAQPFFGILLTHMGYSLDPSCLTAATDGKKIFFSPDFLEKLALHEVEFILLHEIMHICLDHLGRRKYRNQTRFNIACDIVVNAIIMETSSILLKNRQIGGCPVMWKTPFGKSGAEFTAEQVYEMLEELPEDEVKENFGGEQSLDSHDYWEKGLKQNDSDAGCGMNSESDDLKRLWQKRMVSAALIVEKSGYGNLPVMAKRLLEKLRKPKVNWKYVLMKYIKQETFDYSFTDPDRRLGESPFLLPGWSEKKPQFKIWVCVDTSGSMTNDEIAMVLSEIDGIANSCGSFVYVSFFDASITDPVKCDKNKISTLELKGGGGTDFFCIFNYLKDNSVKFNPDLVLIMTDGYAEYPPKSVSRNIPVIWLLINRELNAKTDHQTLVSDEFYPTWGRVIILNNLESR